MKLFIRTLGCQMNFLDSEMIKSYLSENGFEIVDSYQNADFILLNTCTVRKHAEDKAFSILGNYHFNTEKRGKQVGFGIIGCIAQKYGRELLAKIPYLKLICGTHSYDNLPDLLKNARDGKVAIDTTYSETVKIFSRDKKYCDRKYSAYVMATKGCSCECSYCVVPKTRGKQVSRSINDIVAEVQQLAEQGVKEIILLGQNITAYGLDLKPRRSLADLLYEVSNLNTPLDRIGFITSHPAFVSKELFEVTKVSPKITRYLHIPAQSGSDRILKLMKRGYTRNKYEEVIEIARSIIPDIAVASDFIVGFPSETEEDFRKTLSLVEKVRFSSCFIFKYSDRPGTSAVSLTDKVPAGVIKERHHLLLELQKKISYELNQQQVGNIVKVFIEGRSKTDKQKFTGRALDNRIVIVDNKNNGSEIEGKVVEVKINKATALALYGAVVNDGEN